MSKHKKMKPGAHFILTCAAFRERKEQGVRRGEGATEARNRVRDSVFRLRDDEFVWGGLDG